MFQWTGKSRINGHISRCTWPTQIEPGKYKTLKRSTTCNEIEAVILSQKEKPRTRLIHC
jgi:hypothetical protein